MTRQSSSNIAVIREFVIQPDVRSSHLKDCDSWFRPKIFVKPETKLENTEITEQESEYDPASDKEGDQLVAEQPAKEANTNDIAVNFLSKTFCTLSGRAIT